MHHPEAIIAVSVAAIVITSPFVLLSVYRLSLLILGRSPMPINAQFQPVIDELTAVAGNLTTAAQEITTTLANVPLPAGAMDAQDVTDTLSALSAAGTAVTTGAAAVQAAITPEAPSA